MNLFRLRLDCEWMFLHEWTRVTGKKKSFSQTKREYYSYSGTVNGNIPICGCKIIHKYIYINYTLQWNRWWDCNRVALDDMKVQVYMHPRWSAKTIKEKGRQRERKRREGETVSTDFHHRHDTHSLVQIYNCFLVCQRKSLSPLNKSIKESPWTVFVLLALQSHSCGCETRQTVLWQLKYWLTFKIQNKAPLIYII